MATAFHPSFTFTHAHGFHKLCHKYIHINAVLNPSTQSLRKTSLLPIRCRFSHLDQQHGYRRRTGVTSTPNLEATATGVPTSVPVRVAHELLQAGHRYLDVRTPEEFSDGHVHGAFNIPYMFRVGSGMSKNPNFVAEVSSQFGKDDEIIVGCQSGKRSLMAANELLSAGYTGIVDIAGGYAAWTLSELPTAM